MVQAHVVFERMLDFGVLTLGTNGASAVCIGLVVLEIVDKAVGGGYGVLALGLCGQLEGGVSLAVAGGDAHLLGRTLAGRVERTQGLHEGLKLVLGQELLGST